MSEQRAFVVSAIGAALLVPVLALGLVRSEPSYPSSTVAPAAMSPTAAAVAHERMAPGPTLNEPLPQLIRLAPMVITAHAARRAIGAAAPAPRLSSTRDCNPEWRPLAEGPVGRRVRELCR
jgi:hypothetical protein